MNKLIRIILSSKSLSQIWRTALHESGHAMFALKFGFGSNGIRLEGSEHGDGQFEITFGANVIECNAILSGDPTLYSMLNQRNVKHLESTANALEMIYYAGPITEQYLSQCGRSLTALTFEASGPDLLALYNIADFKQHFTLPACTETSASMVASELQQKRLLRWSIISTALVAVLSWNMYITGNTIERIALVFRIKR